MLTNNRPGPPVSRDALFDELDRQRDELRAAEGVTATDFRIKLPGGRWTLQHRGVAGDCVRGMASGRCAPISCHAYGVPTMARFDFSAYPNGVPAIMARAWCHKMQFFFYIYCRAPPGTELVAPALSSRLSASVALVIIIGLAAVPFAIIFAPRSIQIKSFPEEP